MGKGHRLGAGDQQGPQVAVEKQRGRQQRAVFKGGDDPGMQREKPFPQGHREHDEPHGGIGHEGGRAVVWRAAPA